MKKIYINNTKRAVFFGGTMLLPGSNVVDEIDKKSYPQLETMIDDDEIEETDDLAYAAKKANTQEIVDAIMKIGKNDEKTNTAGRKRRQQLDKMEEEAKAAVEAAEKEKKDEEQEMSEEGK